MLQVAVDGASGLWRLGANRHRPGAALVFAGSKEADEALQFVAFADEPDQPAFNESVAAQKLRRLFVVHLRQFGLDLAADRRSACVGPAGRLVQLEAAYRSIQVDAQSGAFANVKCI